MRILLLTTRFIHLDTYFLFINHFLALLFTFVFLCHEITLTGIFLALVEIWILFSVLLISFAMSVRVFRLLISLIISPAVNLRSDIKHLFDQELQNFVFVFSFQFFYLLQSVYLNEFCHICLPPLAVLQAL